MEGFRDFFLQLAAAHINAPLTPIARDFIMGRFDQFVSRRKPPDHPPYSAMIERAIIELNEKSGSSESSISQYLEKTYDFLPVAHAELLKHHLEELCESGDIILTRWKRYKFVGEDRNPIIGAKVSRKKFQGMKRNKHRFKKLSVRKDGVKYKNRKKSDGEETENEFVFEKNVKRKEDEGSKITESFIICSKEMQKSQCIEIENSTSETPTKFESVQVEISEQVKPTPEDDLCESKLISEAPVKQGSLWDELYAEEAVRAHPKIINKYSRRKRKTQEQPLLYMKKITGSTPS